MTRILYLDFSAMARWIGGDHGAVLTDSLCVQNTQIDDVCSRRNSRKRNRARSAILFAGIDTGDQASDVRAMAILVIRVRDRPV